MTPLASLSDEERLGEREVFDRTYNCSQLTVSGFIQLLFYVVNVEDYKESLAHDQFCTPFIPTVYAV